MKKKIALSSNTSWYLYNFRRNTITALLSQGYDVVCFAPYDSFSPKLEALGASFIPVRMNAAGTNPVSELLLLLCIFRLVAMTKPDMLFNFTIKMNVYFGLSARLLSLPYVNNVSGLGTVFIHRHPLFGFARALYGFVNGGASKVFFQNSDDKELFERLRLVNPEKSVPLPGSGVDTARFLHSNLPVGETPFTFLMIGRLIADKGVREFVQAAKYVKAAIPDTRLILVGPGGISNKSAIGDDELNQWRSEGIVELVGEQDDVLPWIQDCHVLVLPSYREGMPRSVLEAASVGRPAIVTDVPGCRQSIVPGETGWLCKARDAQSLAETMARVMELPRTVLEEMGSNAARRARAEFSEQVVITHYLKCLEEIA